MAKGDQKRGQEAVTRQTNTVNPATQQFQQQYFGNQQQGGGGGGGGNEEAFFNQMFPGETLTPQMLDAKEAELNKQGYKVVRSASGQAGKIQGPTGEVFDVIQGRESGLNKKQFLRNDPKFNPSAGGGGVFGQGQAEHADIMGKFGEFAKTGGFSPDDLANIRARATSPTRGIYARGQQELQRSKALQGGYSPNLAAGTAKLAREGSQQISDINRATEADIGEMVQRGRLAGIGGMAQQYGNIPGMASLTQRGMLESQGQGINLAELQQRQANIPGDWQQGVKNVGSGIDLAGDVGNMIYPWLE